MSHNVTMPEMGEGVAEGTILSWLVQEGDYVNEHDPVLEVETDKVTVEVTAEASGTVLKILASAGHVVEVGAVLAVIGEAGEAVEEEVEAVPAGQGISQSAGGAPTNAPIRRDRSAQNVPQPNGHGREFDGVRVSPVVARMVREHDLDVTQIEGTGRDGRITKRDVLAFLEGHVDAPASMVRESATPTIPISPAPKASAPPATSADDADGEIMPLNGMRRSIAEHMVMSKRTSPHVTTVFEFDYSAVVAHRAEHKAQFARDGVKLTYMPYLAMATVEALKAHPLANAMWTDEGILLKKDINLGIAVAVSNGLLVPVIRHADSMNLLGLARSINDLAERGRTNKLKPDELRGGTFSITNHGASGSLIGTPIINQPQVGILGVGMIEKRVKVVEGDAIAVRPCAYVSFSFDHRILDGATADAFVMTIKDRIEGWR